MGRSCSGLLVRVEFIQSATNSLPVGRPCKKKPTASLACTVLPACTSSLRGEHSLEEANASAEHHDERTQMHAQKWQQSANGWWFVNRIGSGKQSSEVQKQSLSFCQGFPPELGTRLRSYFVHNRRVMMQCLIEFKQGSHILAPLLINIFYYFLLVFVAHQSDLLGFRFLPGLYLSSWCSRSC